VIDVLKEKLAEQKIDADIDGRPKHFYSIYRKMRQQNKSFDQIFDLIAVRIIVDTIPDCYAALGVVQILLGRGIDLDLTQAIARVAQAQPVPVSEDVQRDVLAFIAGRLDVLLHEQGWAHDVIAAVLAEQSARPARVIEGVRELAAWVAREDWSPILDNYARCVRITRPETETYPVDPALFEDEAEHALFAAYEAAAAQLSPDSNVGAFLSAFAPTVPAIQQFFEAVLVNAPDAAVRQNRLGLLQAIAGLAHDRADLSQLAGF
ncbi:MAG TPA: glycine--tRNA ligase subunit beta, partial [Aggregatilinea sp.]|uniref:glycine--tRNA ligase subunit beta n=1 Tax=Aggregatilinea sp. TaxID=2806333 RepID=UPI002C103E62